MKASRIGKTQSRRQHLQDKKQLGDNISKSTNTWSSGDEPLTGLQDLCNIKNTTWKYTENKLVAR